MASPISNNNPAHVGNNKPVRADERGRGHAHGHEQVSGVAAGRQDDAVSVSRVAQVLSEEPSLRGQGTIQSAAHAAEVAQGIKALFEGNTGQALAAQAKNISSDLMELLKAS